MRCDLLSILVLLHQGSLQPAIGLHLEEFSNKKKRGNALAFFLFVCFFLKHF